eukprot:1554394-Rhodomonas_salina.1
MRKRTPGNLVQTLTEMTITRSCCGRLFLILVWLAVFPCVGADPEKAIQGLAKGSGLTVATAGLVAMFSVQATERLSNAAELEVGLYTGKGWWREEIETEFQIFEEVRMPANQVKTRAVCDDRH